MIADEILAGLQGSQQTILREILRQATVVRLQNVADFYWDGSAKDEWDAASDFPNCAPPWPLAFFEWRVPEYSRTEVAVAHNPLSRCPIGVMVQALSVPEPLTGSGAAWALRLTGFSPWLRATGGDLGCAFLFVAPDGRLLVRRARDFDRKLATWALTPEFQPTVLNTALESDDWFFPLRVPTGCTDPQAYHLSALHLFRNPVLLGLSFSHCKNVELESHEVPLKLHTKRQRAGRAPVVRWYVLNILPMTRIVKAAAQRDCIPVSKALHICRGHFKDYRERGLFGKRYGLYWWDMHLRGSLTSGLVAKDYAVAVSAQ